MGFSCVFHAFFMRLHAFFHAFFMRFSCVFHTFFMRFSCVFHAFFIRFPYVFHTFFMQHWFPSSEDKVPLKAWAGQFSTFQNPDFLLRNPDFLLKTDDFIIKQRLAPSRGSLWTGAPQGKERLGIQKNDETTMKQRWNLYFVMMVFALINVT